MQGTINLLCERSPNKFCVFRANFDRFGVHREVWFWFFVEKVSDCRKFGASRTGVDILHISYASAN